MNHSRQAVVTDFIAGAGDSLWLDHPPLEGRWSLTVGGEQWPPQTPRPRHSFVPASRFSHCSGVCLKTRLGSSRLGGGAATTPWVTSHPEAARENQANPRLRLRA